MKRYFFCGIELIGSLTCIGLTFGSFALLAAESQGDKGTFRSYSIFQDTMVELAWPQVRQAASDGALVLVPIGVIEEHGPHMGLGADIYLAHLRCRRIQAGLASHGTKAILAPPLYWGITDDTKGFPGSFNIRPETMSGLLTDLCRSFQSWGFRRLVFVNDHGDANHRRTLKESLARIREQLKVEAYSLDAMLTSVPVYELKERPGRFTPDYHAGAAETGVMVREFPGEVDIQLAENLNPQSEFPPSGYVGDPAGYRKDDSLCKYFTEGTEYDVRRVLAFFFPQSSLSQSGFRERSGRAIDQKARALLSACIQAQGGQARLEAVRTQVRYGTLKEGTTATPLQAAWSAEGKWAMSLGPTNALVERFGFNGTYGWHAEKGRVAQLPDPLMAALSWALDPRLSLRLEKQFASIGKPRTEQVKGKSVWIVEGELSSGTKVVLTFDAETGLILNVDETSFADYRDVDGVRIPFTVTIRPGAQACFEAMENNMPVEATVFLPPP